MFRPRTFVRGNEIIRKNRTFGTARYTTVRKYAVTGERKGPPTLWYLGNVDGPQCHANQVVPATGLVDDAITPARKKGIVDQAGKLDLLPCRGNGFPAIRRRLTHGRVRYKESVGARQLVRGHRPAEAAPSGTRGGHTPVLAHQLASARKNLSGHLPSFLVQWKAGLSGAVDPVRAIEEHLDVCGHIGSNSPSGCSTRSRSPFHGG